MTDVEDAGRDVGPPPIRQQAALHVFVHQVLHVLAGLEYPAQRWEILTWAEHNGVGVDLRRALQELPPGTYGKPEGVITQLIKAGVFVSLRSAI